MENINELPEKTVERLSLYRRVLLDINPIEKQFIFSHELALLLHITPVQVRRDLMLISYSGTLRRGYEIKELIELIGQLIDPKSEMKVAVIGMGNLGCAITGYFLGKRSKLDVIAGFDNDVEKINRIVSGISCYSISDLNSIIREKGIKIAILTQPPEFTVTIAEQLIAAGISGILNYTSVPLQVPSGIFLEEYDMITSIEKVAYFVKKSTNI